MGWCWLKQAFFSSVVLLVGLALSGPASATVEVWAVGDGSNESQYDNDVAEMIESENPDAFLYLGDVYQFGSPLAFENYDESYGRFFFITYPTSGNHE